MSRLVEWAHTQHCHTASTKVVLMCLAAFADEQHRVAIPPKDLARMCRISPRSVSRALSDLRFDRLIARRGAKDQVAVIEILYCEAQP